MRRALCFPFHFTLNSRVPCNFMIGKWKGTTGTSSHLTLVLHFIPVLFALIWTQWKRREARFKLMKQKQNQWRERTWGERNTIKELNETNTHFVFPTFASFHLLFYCVRSSFFSHIIPSFLCSLCLIKWRKGKEKGTKDARFFHLNKTQMKQTKRARVVPSPFCFPFHLIRAFPYN